jgi:hypothetical protein
MPFETIRSQVRASSIDRDKPSVAIYLTHYKGTPAALLSLRFPYNLLVRLGWNAGDVIQVAEGTGSDAGVLLLTKAKPGYTLTTPGRDKTDAHLKDLTFGISATKLKHHILPLQPIPMDAAPAFQVFNGQLQIMLPDYVNALPAIIA